MRTCTGALWSRGAARSRGAAQLPRSSSCSYNCASCGCHGPCFLPKEEDDHPLPPTGGRSRAPSEPCPGQRRGVPCPRCPPAAAPQPGESSRLEAAPSLPVCSGIFYSVAMTTVAVTSPRCLSRSGLHRFPSRASSRLAPLTWAGAVPVGPFLPPASLFSQ